MHRTIHRDDSPTGKRSHVVLAHGGGGRTAQELMDRLFGQGLDAISPRPSHEGALIEINRKKLVLATGSYVVNPLFFPGGDIGCLSVNGTVNDLAMCGSRPLFLAVGLILEEGLDLEALSRIIASMHAAADRARVRIATGDTKVVNRGRGDGLYVNTTGLGVLEHPALEIAPEKVRPGDALLINGDIGRHGIAIMSSREGLGYDRSISSDCAAVDDLVLGMLDAGIEIHCLRGLTRGGLAGQLNEVSRAANRRIELDQAAIPVSPVVREACAFLGLDPYHISNEGRFVAFVTENDAARALELLNRDTSRGTAVQIGRVAEQSDGLVVLQPSSGPSSILDISSGEHLPR